MERTISEIEDELDELQAAYLEEELPTQQRIIERRFDECLAEATALDGILRIERGVTIVNWVREEDG